MVEAKRAVGAAAGEGHPRPQLTRPEWIDLSGTWQFAYDDSDVGRRENWQARPDCFNRTIEVPFPPESAASGIGDKARHDVLWYRRTFTAPVGQGADRDVLLHFGAVDYAADVWVDGRHVAHHEGGHTPFTADITASLSTEGEHVLVVRAQDVLDDREQPRGKQYWRVELAEVWYHRTSGIWQPVWLESVPRRRIETLRWSPNFDERSVRLQLALNAWAPIDPPLQVRVQLTLHDRLVVDDTITVTDRCIDRTMALPAAFLTELQVTVFPQLAVWTPEQPNLVDAQLTLLDGEAPLDRVDSYFGMRSVDTTEGAFLLNGRPYYLRQVLAQGYWPESHLAAPSGEALRREVELIKQLGFNGVRMHQKAEDPRFLYWCDRLGLLVSVEMPSPWLFSQRAAARTTVEWLEILQRDYSHPSVAMWVPFNESWGVMEISRSDQQRSFVLALYHLTRTQDPTRPVIGNDGWEHVVADIWTIHDYAMAGSALQERYGDAHALARTVRDVQPAEHRVSVAGVTWSGQPVVLSEFGGISYITADAPDVGWAYARVRDAESFLAKYEELVGAVLKSTALAGFCYTQLADMEQERNGILDEHRRAKVDPATIAEINRRPSRSMPAELITYNVLTHADVSPPPI